MKVRKWVVLLIVLAGVTVIGFAQEQTIESTYVPEFADEPVLLNADNSVTSLEKQVAKARAKPGLLSSKVFYDVSGGNSPVVLKKTDENNFIVRLGNPDQAPDTQYTISQWIANKNVRSLVIGSSNLGGTKAGNTSKTLSDRGSEIASRIISINLSGPSLLDESLVELILGEVRRNALRPSSFCFEITETAAIQNYAAATRFIKRLKDEGFTFALDDFGSGFSSFAYLKNLPVDYLKIDGSFVQTIDESLVSYTMVDSINSIGHVMGIKTIAEFVKSPEIKQKCAEIGVDYAQGYHIAEPIPLL